MTPIDHNARLGQPQEDQFGALMRKLTNDEFEMLAEQLANAMSADLGPNFPGLSDYAVSREGIYEDHP